MSDFDRIIQFTIWWETGGDKNGGYTNDPRDPGGETRWGISKLGHPEEDIKNLTQARAAQIYLETYWASTGNQESGCDQLPWPLNAAHFDCVVNVGNRKIAKDGTVVMHRRANQILQRALMVDDDGYLGPMTIKAAQEMQPELAAKRALAERDLYYDSRGPWADIYRNGWKNRTAALKKNLGI
jgi:lysozyme family protein